MFAPVDAARHQPRLAQHAEMPRDRRERHIELGYQRPAPRTLPLKQQIEAIERRLLVQALRNNDNNKTRTAKRLGLSRYGFLKKLDKYHLRDR